MSHRTDCVPRGPHGTAPRSVERRILVRVVSGRFGVNASGKAWRGPRLRQAAGNESRLRADVTEEAGEKRKKARGEDDQGDDESGQLRACHADGAIGRMVSFPVMRRILMEGGKSQQQKKQKKAEQADGLPNFRKSSHDEPSRAVRLLPCFVSRAAREGSYHSVPIHSIQDGPRGGIRRLRPGTG